MTTKPKQSHTPTPWNVEALKSAIMPGMIMRARYSQETAEANASFIVRACNSHDNLIAAIKTLQKSAQKDNRLLDLRVCVEAITEAESTN